MRIIAGTAKGRRVDVPPRGTRPFTGKVREAVFSSLAVALPGADVLDLYAGSGSLGLEALSRGAASCVFVERDRSAVRVLRRNVETVGLGGSVVVEEVSRFLRRATGAYDLVFVDPPYVAEDMDAVLRLAARRMVSGALAVVHRRVGEPASDIEFLSLVTDRRYGDAHIRVLRKEEA
jgi:16S rRNA (guanine966-N2)-methyltransferase